MNKPAEAETDAVGVPRRLLYVVATVHLDTQWRWTIQDTIREFIPATLQRNFELIDRFPFFVVSFEGAFRYMLMQEYYPEAFDRLKQQVTAGRWRVAGSMLDSPDVNIVSPESLLRHILYGNRFFERQLGQRSTDLFLPDCFGFGQALPSIAAHCGLQGFSAQKFGNWMSPATIPFEVGVWQGPDGAEIVAAIRPEGYGEGLDEDLSSAERYVDRIDATGRQSGAFVGMKYVGIGDRGGGLDDDSMQWLERSVEGQGPIRVLISGSDQLFRDLQPNQIERLPRHSGELLLPTHGTGCLTSQAVLKRWNRRNEQLADAAERASSIADWLGALPYPASILGQAWQRFLWHQMHDDLTGTSIPAAYRFTVNDLLLSLNQFAGVLTDAVGAIAGGMNTQARGLAVVVFNPLSIERQDVVSIELPNGSTAESVRVIGPEGLDLSAQLTVSNGTTRVHFLATLPALGLAAFDLILDQGRAEIESPLQVGPDWLENQRYRVEIAGNGDIARIFDKTLGQELLRRPATLELLRDRSARWPAWEILQADLESANSEPFGDRAEIRIVEKGPVRVALEIVRRRRGSTLTQRISLAQGGAGERLDISCDLDWRTRGRMLKAVFPLAAANPQATYDLGLGVIKRGNNCRQKYEVPAQQWADLASADGTLGVSILNDCKYGWDKPDDQTLRLTLVRSPRVIRKFRHQGRQDLGHHRFNYSLFGHGADWRISDTSWQAARINQPPLAFWTSSHRGPLPRSISFLGTSRPALAVQSLKRAEEGGDLVLRVRELSGKTGPSNTVSWLSGIRSAHRVNGMEEQPQPVELAGGMLPVESPGFAVSSYRLEVEPPEQVATPRRGRPLTLPFEVVAISHQGEHRSDGVDGKGHSIPAELFPERLTRGGVELVLGPVDRGRPNALPCRAQVLQVDDPDLDRLHLLVASLSGPTPASFRVGDRVETRVVPAWTGFLATRETHPGRLRFGGAARSAPDTGSQHRIAWIGTHRHDGSGIDEPYVFCYLFRLVFELPAGCGNIVLPDEPRIMLFAATLSNERLSATLPAQPLYD